MGASVNYIERFAKSFHGSKIIASLSGVLDEIKTNNVMTEYLDTIEKENSFKNRVNALNEITRIIGMNPYKFRTSANQEIHVKKRVHDFLRQMKFEQKLSEFDLMTENELTDFIDNALESFPFYDADVYCWIKEANERYFKMKGEYYLQTN